MYKEKEVKMKGELVKDRETKKKERERERGGRVGNTCSLFCTYFKNIDNEFMVLIVSFEVSASTSVFIYIIKNDFQYLIFVID